MPQHKSVLIAIPRKILRKGISAIFAEEKGINVSEAATCAELITLLAAGAFDLIIIHQSINVNLALLPRGNFILLTSELDPRMMLAARLHGARAYLWENASEHILRQTLFLDKGAFLTDEAISAAFAEYITNHTFVAIKHDILSAREQEIFQLLWQGLRSSEVARCLHISESTIKTHVKRIYEKLRSNRYQIKILSLLTENTDRDPQPCAE